MQRLTPEWIAKAEGDWNSALRELRARKTPNYDAACFHAQQCAEKYLKVRLQEADVRFGKTHNLIALLKLVLPIEPDWDDLRKALQVLTEFAVEVRYLAHRRTNRWPAKPWHIARRLGNVYENACG